MVKTVNKWTGRQNTELKVPVESASIFLASSPQMILRLEQQFFNVGEFVKRDALLLQ